MLLKRFRARKVHGYLDFDIKFLDRLTFITGINGSGKTTALNAIQALLAPDLSALANLRYDYLKVEITHSGTRLSIEARAEERGFRLSTSPSHAISVPRFVADSEAPPTYRQSEAETEHFRDFLRSHLDDPVFESISKLPTPMFLGIDRRSRFEADARHARFPTAARPFPVGRNLFSGSISASLSDATRLITARYRNALIASGRLSNEVQGKLLLNLITLSVEDFGRLSIPEPSEVSDLKKLRENLDELAKILDLPSADIQTRVGHFLSSLQKAADAIPPNSSLKELVQADKQDQKKMTALLTWSVNRPQLRKIRDISEVVSSYNAERSALFEPFDAYNKLINGFLEDSGKKIDFDANGFPHVKVRGLDGEKPIASLSSGEGQVFVILTQLSFSTLAQKANVFIIDEPELSLHVRWQELFVDSILAANQSIQYILATHSPSIILDRTNDCVDLSFQKPRGRVG